MRIDSSLVRAFSPGFSLCVYCCHFRANSVALTNINGKEDTIELDENEENLLMLLIATFEAVRFKCDIKKKHNNEEKQFWGHLFDSQIPIFHAIFKLR